MLKKSLLSLSASVILAAAVQPALAQSTPAPAPAAAAPAVAPSAAKKELIARLIKLQRSGIEAMARDMTQEPAVQMLDRAASILQARVAPEKREAVVKNMQADAKTYVDQTVPVVRDRAVALAPDTIGPVLDQKLSEDELKKVIAILESPEYAKYQQLGGDMLQALQTKLVNDTRSTVETNLKTLESALGNRLNAAVAQGTDPAAAAAAPAKAAATAKPAAKAK